MLQCGGMENNMKKVEDYVRSIPDFPEKGIIFRDITSVIQDPEGLKLAIDGIQNLLKDVDFDVVVGTESRGFIFGVPIAYKEKKPFCIHNVSRRLKLNKLKSLRINELQYNVKAGNVRIVGGRLVLSLFLLTQKYNLFSNNIACKWEGYINLISAFAKGVSMNCATRLMCEYLHLYRCVNDIFQ